MQVFIIYVFLTIINSFIITMIVDIILMGRLTYHFAGKCEQKKYIVAKRNRIDMQTGYKCSAYASAYVLRHYDVDASGEELYTEIPNKTKNGYVYPKGIKNLLERYAFRIKYCSGNLNALKKEVSKGNPVIIMIRTEVGKKWLHFVPVVGYDEKHIFIAESIKDYVNCGEEFYNRKIDNKTFLKLWNTGMLKMPLYRYTYIVMQDKI